MRATAVNFLKFLQGTKQFVIPIYQRTYSWKIENCQQLWDDILRIAQDDQIPAHFLGSVVYVERGIYHVSSITQLLLIDGQQRLTTLSLLLAALGERLATEVYVTFKAYHQKHNKLSTDEIVEDIYRYSKYFTVS